MMTANGKWYRALVALFIPVLVGFGPCTSGPRLLQVIPGGVLEGELATRPVSDWGEVQSAGICALEIRPDFPHSITVYCASLGEKLYVGCRACPTKTWSDYAVNDNRGRIKIGDTIYPVTLQRVWDEATIRAFVGDRLPADAPLPEGFWLFELASR